MRSQRSAHAYQLARSAGEDCARNRRGSTVAADVSAATRRMGPASLVQPRVRSQRSAHAYQLARSAGEESARNRRGSTVADVSAPVQGRARSAG